MRLSIASLLLSCAGLVASLPAKSYSVVNVDGQTGASGAPAETGSAQSSTTPEATITATITPTVTQTEVSSATQTILSTLIITQPSFEQTIIITITQVQTTTASPPPTSTEYYDDGMWHTYYPKKPEPTNGTWSNSSASA